MALGEPTVVIAAGGTGGHIYPGLALAGALRRSAPGARIVVVGTTRGLERTLVPRAGFELQVVGMVPFAGWRRAVLPAALVRAAAQSRGILRREQADVAVGMGGYASIPLIVGARLARVPALVHESGAVPGRANLVAARLTTNVATAFAEATAHFPSSADVRTVGMPLGPELTGFDRPSLRPQARAALGVAEATTLVLVNGGSQGAASLNRLALGLARRWRGRSDVRILLKTGTAHLDAVTAELTADATAHVVEASAYLPRMDHAYAAADVTVCRAGAGTVAELAVVGLPAVLVPYPHAPHDHQAHNARPLVDAGGAVLVRDHEATADVVGPTLEGPLGTAEGRDAMRARLGALSRPHAAEDLAAWALDLARAEH